MTAVAGPSSLRLRRPSARRGLAMVAAVLVVSATLLARPSTASAQGRCIRAYGTPACNTDPIPPVFAPTGWRTVGLDHITFRVVDPEAEAAFYVALMGWKVRSATAEQVVLDMGDWGTCIFRKAPLSSFPAPAEGAPGGAARRPVHAIVEGVSFAIEPWDAKAVEAELRKRGLTPVPDKDGKGYESFHVKDPDGFALEIGNAQGYVKARRTPAAGRPATPLPFDSTGWQTVWLDHFSWGATNYKATVSFYLNLFGWQPTYDEGSQNEVMMAEVGDAIIRGGNPLDPEFGTGTARRRLGIDHISFGISPWDTDRVKAELEKRGLSATIDTSDGAEIHVAQYKSYHTITPNGYNLQISYNTRDTRLNLAVAVNPRRPGVK